jgi:hypothetical protein
MRPVGSNEKELSYRWRERAWIGMEVVSSAKQLFLRKLRKIHALRPNEEWKEKLRLFLRSFSV